MLTVSIKRNGTVSMGSKIRYHTTGIPLFTQALRLKQSFPDSTIHIRRQRLVWEGILHPSLLSDKYHIRVEYRYGRRPIVIVYGDNLLRIDDPNLPHHFRVDPERKRIQMCLHLPGEFTPRMLLTKTILPWAAEWLLHYEVWLATNEWHGGGFHPAPRTPHRTQRQHLE